MSQKVHERVVILQDVRGRRFDLARVYAAEQKDGTWQGFIEFRSAEGEIVRTDRETTQSNLNGVAYWAVFLEGALNRAVERS